MKVGDHDIYNFECISREDEEAGCTHVGRDSISSYHSRLERSYGGGANGNDSSAGLFGLIDDAKGAGYHIANAKVAIGSGGWLGKGWMDGTQSQLQFIPEKSTDFLLAVYSEEFGLIGVILLLVLYLLLISRGLSIAHMAQTRFDRLLAGSLSMIIFTYVFVNMGMVAGILPVVGVPLPFMSYGGTALVTLGVACGMLMSIRHHRIR